MITDSLTWINQLFKGYSSPYPWISGASVLCGIAACRLVYDCSKSISSSWFKHYPSLPRMKRVEWDNRAVSTTHAVFITVLSIYLAFWSDLYTDDQQREPVIFRCSSLSTFVLGVSAGYFISDLSMIFWFYPSLGGMEYVLHHLLSMSALVYAALTGQGQFYTFLALISETTTPGINLRWYLDVVGMKRSKAYVSNGVFIFMTWLVARILLFMYVFYHLYNHSDQIKTLPIIARYFIVISPSVLAVLNLMWFSKITTGMIKTLTAKKD